MLPMRLTLTPVRDGRVPILIHKNYMVLPMRRPIYIKGVPNGIPVNVLKIAGTPVLKTRLLNETVNLNTLQPGMYIMQIFGKKKGEE